MNKVLYILFLPILLQCATSKLSPEEYIEYYEASKSSYIDSVQTPDFTIEIIEKPINLLVAHQLVDDGDESFEPKKKEIEKMSVSFYSFYIKTNSSNLFATSSWSKERQMKFYSTDFKKHIFGINSSGDTCACSVLLFQANANFGNQAYFELEFPSKNITSIYWEILPMNKTVSVKKSNLNSKEPQLKLR